MELGEAEAVRVWEWWWWSRHSVPVAQSILGLRRRSHGIPKIISKPERGVTWNSSWSEYESTVNGSWGKNPELTCDEPSARTTLSGVTFVAAVIRRLRDG